MCFDVHNAKLIEPFVSKQRLILTFWARLSSLRTFQISLVLSHFFFILGKSRMATSEPMDQFDESMKKKIELLLRAMNLVKSFKEDSIPCKIDEGLFLGSVGTAANRNALKNLNITHILIVAGKLTPAHPGDFVYKTIDVADRDDANLKQYFDECFDFIDEGKRHGGGVLVHCFAGKSRSVTIVVAYLMKTRGMSLSEALEHVKSKRPQAAPNPGFIRQLEDFEKSLQGDTGNASST